MTKTSGQIWIVGLGPGAADTLTPQARAAIERAGLIIGYTAYCDWVRALLGSAMPPCLALDLGQEAERARLAIGRALEGETVCVISSGDPGIYGMASVVLELLEPLSEEKRPAIEVVPGVSAVNASAALLGAPLGHDFAVISLSDLLTPWEAIECRLRAAAAADFVLALLNPQSRRRDWQLARARDLLLEARRPDTPVGIVRNAFRPDQAVVLTTLADMLQTPVDMFSTVFVGNRQTRCAGTRMFTPRGYRVE